MADSSTPNVITGNQSRLRFDKSDISSRMDSLLSMGTQKND